MGGFSLLQEHNGAENTLQHDTCSAHIEECGDMHNPQEQYTKAAQSHQGERDRGPDLEAAGRGSSYGGPQGELQGEAPAQREAGREGQTGEEEKDSLLEVACCIDFVQASFHQSKPTDN